ncbi:MAG: cytochrome B6 [Sulfobacillus thermotolerans]|uniref:Cytochrome B6 n=1 Tax=Sulfobacillus thermotolerans TaxID=338644 RepID=A0ABM6RP86_9FIRM|nr:cytochrome B6 [Sulfobacillus thermotolerans]MCY0908255.1 cytochrome B6 [Sulfobacillus thermotolerans]
MAARPTQDVVTDYRYVPEDFMKHLMGTLGIVTILVLVLSALFGVPEKPPLTIQKYATQNPVTFEQVSLRALDGQGSIANYGPPYNNGTGNVESILQKWTGIIHPVNAAQDFILKPLTMAATLNPSIKPALTQFESASPALQTLWEQNYTKALDHARVVNGQVVVPKGVYGPVASLMNATLRLGKSGLMSGALIRNPNVVNRFDNQNYLLFLQGQPLQTAAAPLQLGGTQWGIIHSAIPGYPAAWWMTIPTWIYQWPFVANSSASDAIALSIGFLFWLALAFTPWIPGWNQVPRYLGLYKLVWKDYYRTHRTRKNQGDHTRGIS